MSKMTDKICPIMQLTKAIQDNMTSIFCLGEDCVCYSKSIKIEHCNLTHAWKEIKEVKGGEE